MSIDANSARRAARTARVGEMMGRTLAVVDSDGDGRVNVVVGVADAGGKIAHPRPEQ